MSASSSKDVVKKFHSLPHSSPVQAISNVFNGVPAVNPANNNSEVGKPKPAPSVSSFASSLKSCKKNRRKQKEKKVVERKLDEEVDDAALQLFEASDVKSSSSVNFCPALGVFIHGYGTIPVIKGDFRILPEKVQRFVTEKARIMQPRAIYICDGSLFEFEEIMEDLVRTKQVKSLKGGGPSVYLARTDPDDVDSICAVVSTKRSATTESQGCAKNKVTKWMSAHRFRLSLASRFPACMRGRVMYVVPFSMGPIGSYNSINAVQLTDSAFVVAHSHILTRVSAAVWDALGTADFIGCIHSVGRPRPLTDMLTQHWLCNPGKAFVGHCMEKREVWSFGSNNIQNALSAKKNVALRMASVIGRDEGWLVQHMAIISVTNTKGQEFFIGVALPAGVGKTTLATMQPSIADWKIQVIGDDVAWLKFDPSDGQMYAMNPENGINGIAPGLTRQHNPALANMIDRNTIFTNVAETSDGRAWWQGNGEQLSQGASIINWRGKDLSSLTKMRSEYNLDGSVLEQKNVIANCEGRFASRCKNYPLMHPRWEDPKGVPLSAIIFGCRRSNGVPLISEAFNWQHGVFLAASLRNESAGNDRSVQSDPMGMGSCIGYNLAHYFRHWLSMDKQGRKMPRIFLLNSFLRDSDSGKLLWPGFGENVRVLDWITQRLTNTQEGSFIEKNDFLDSAIGRLPMRSAFNLKNLDQVDWQKLMTVNEEFWTAECDSIKNFLREQMGSDVPPQMMEELEAVQRRLKDAFYKNNNML